MDADLQAVRDVVDAADLPDEVRERAAWCLGRLPKLYRELAQTSEARFSDEIRRLVQALLVALSPASHRTAEAVTLRLAALHERLGLPNLDLKPVRQRKTG
jgi:hypothetical protein